MASPYPRYPGGALIANKSASHTLDDSTELDPNVGFIPDQDGSFVGRLRGDSADVTFNVLGGVFYPFDVKLAKDTGKSGVTALRVYRWAPSA